MRRALLTGATSYLGLALADALTETGVEVHAVVRPTSDRKRFDRLTEPPKVYVHDGKEGSLAGIVAAARPDAVFHLATRYLREHEPDQVADLIDSNVRFGALLLEAMAGAGIKRIVAAGTYFQHFNATGYRPLNLYAATKQAFDDILAYYVDAKGFQATTLVLFDVYGPGDWRKKLPGAMLEAQRTGAPLPVPTDDIAMDLVYVADAAEAFVHAAERLEEDPASVAGGRFAVSSGERKTIAEIAKVFEAAGGKPVPLNVGGYAPPPRAISHPWSGPALPGWRPRVSLADGVRRFIEGTPS